MLQRLIVGLLCAVLAASVTAMGAGGAELEAGFRNPPHSARPWVFWFWLDGNITREGITADLEAMHRVGIAGVTLMEVDAFIPKGPVRFMSAPWRALFQHALKEAARLDIEVAMNNDGGWSGSGGPWIRPEQAMQMTVWSETHISGPRRFSGPLPQPKTAEGYYRDIAVLAFPTPAADAARMAAANPKIAWGAGRKPLDAAKLMDGNAATVEELPALNPGEAHTVDIEFPRPFTARSLALSFDRKLTAVHGVLAVSRDGKEFATVREFDAKWPLATVSFAAATARHFRLTLTQEGRAAATLPLGDLELLGGERIEGIAGKAAYVNEPYHASGVSAEAAPGVWPGRKQVLDIGARMNASGRLAWDVPAGEWTVLRIGHTPTAQRNHPSPLEGIGLECDKLSKPAVEAHFAGMMEKLVADQKAAGVASMRYAHIDSWEAASQNWTPRMREEFLARRGYDPLPFLPVVTGRIVESREVSERFLWDLRRTLADMVTENYAGHFRQLAHKSGLQLSMEAYGNGPLDNLSYAGAADLLMTEFWMGMEPWWGTKEMASAAHIYGHSVLAAEAFTSRSPAGKWQNHPFRMKPLGDRMFTAGVNRFVFHRYAHQPWLDRWPGMTMGPYGIEFDRTITWWEQSKAYLDYVARCQYLLQQGRFTADVVYLAGDKVPDDFHEPSVLSPEIPSGYGYDVMPAGLLARTEMRDGRVTLPSGMSYRVLVLPAGNTMRVAQLRQVKQLVEAGATVVGPPPVRSPSLAEAGAGDAEVRRLAHELWGEADGVNVQEHRLGKGRVVWGKPLANVLREVGAPPDFASLGVDSGERIRYIHRTADGKDIYFIASAESAPATFLCTFRVAGKRPELWWPDSGRIERVAAYDRQAAQTRIPIHLDAYGSVFVVFAEDSGGAGDAVTAVLRDGVEVSGIAATSVGDLRGKMQGFTLAADADGQYRMEVDRPGTYEVKTVGARRFGAVVDSVPDAVEVSGPWDVSFPPGWGAPERIALDRLLSWTAHPNDGVKYFSGTATYRRTVTVPAAMLGEGRALYLDLGRVEAIAEVKLNGRGLGVLWKPPFRVEITGVARAGANELEVRVVNLWPNRLIGDERLPRDREWNGGRLMAWPQWFTEGRKSPAGQFTFMTWRHWRPEDALLESGLLGPVRLEAPARVPLTGAEAAPGPAAAGDAKEPAK